MIVRSKGLVFVHIPKTAGTSIQNLLVDSVPGVEDPPDLDLAWGWCPERKRWLQHLTIGELLELGLLSDREFRSFFKFAVVRNPFDRAVSDYRFLLTQAFPFGSFAGLYRGSRRWASVLANPDQPSYRGDHLRPQVDYVSIDGAPVLDHIGRFEDLAATVEIVRREAGLPTGELGHAKRSSRPGQHYSHFYSDRERALVEELAAGDLDRFDYSFEDRRTAMTRLRRPARRAREVLAAVGRHGRRRLGRRARERRR